LSARAPTSGAAVRRRGTPAVRNRHLGLVVSLAAVVAVVLAIGSAFSGSLNTIAGGTKIDGVDVGGLSPGAAQRLLARMSARVANVPIVFVAGTRRFSLRASELSVEPDWGKAVTTAAEAGGGMDVLRGFRRLELDFDPVDVTPPIDSYQAAVNYEIGLIAVKVDRPDRPARLERRGAQVTVVPGRPGEVLDRQSAAEIVVAALAGFSRGNPVELPTSVAEPTVTTADLAGARASAAKALSAPVRLALGPRRFVLTPSELAPMLQLPASGGQSLVLGGAAADAYFAKLNRIVGRPAYGAHFAAAGDHVSVVPQQPGVALDVPTSAAAVLAAAESPTDRVARLVAKKVTVGRTTAAAAAMGITGVVSSYETVYGGVPNRIHNVELVAHLLNGKLIAPGSTFSFNRATGNRTAAKGFLEAPVIINGELQTGLGGGVCQVSTTVFNAAFVAGLPITARTNHALYISHYPLGRDATVDYPDIDLKFVNDTGHWLLLRTFVGPSSLVVTLYGTPQHRRIVTNTAPLVQTAQMPIERTLDRALTPGTSVIESYGEPAYSTSVQRLVYAPGGKLLSNVTWYSNYRSLPEVVEVGPQAKPAAKPKPKPAAPAATTPAAPAASTPPPGSAGLRFLR
jgi:vancomycin resistance protein YoaR